MGAASQELIAQNRSILRTRLLAISAVSLLGHSLFFIRSLLLEYSFAWVQITPLIILSAGIFLLWKQWDFSDTQLRWLGIVIFGTGLVYLAWVHYLAVVLLAERGDVVITSVAIDQIPQSFFALMVMYGMFIPNTWRPSLSSHLSYGCDAAATEPLSLARSPDSQTSHRRHPMDGADPAGDFCTSESERESHGGGQDRCQCRGTNRNRS